MSKKNVSKNIEEVVDATGKVAEQVAETVEESWTCDTWSYCTRIRSESACRRIT